MLHDRPAFETADLRAILSGPRNVAVVGASTDPYRPSAGVMAYLRRAGWRVVPVNPYEVGKSLYGTPFVARLQDIGERVDIVDVFRRPDAVPEVVEDTIAIGCPVLWLQLGVVNEAAARRAREAGIAVVMNRCISVELSRLGL